MLERRGAIGAVLRLTRLVRSARCYDRRDRWSVGCRTGAQSVVVGLELSLRSVLLWSSDWSSVEGLGSLFFLSLSLCLCARVRKWFKVKIFTSNHFRVKAIKTHGQLKIFSGKFIFHVQPNTRIYGKTFLEVI